MLGTGSIGSTAGGHVTVVGANITIPKGIYNDSPKGTGGTVTINGTNSAGLSFPGSVPFISEKAGTDGGSVIITNLGPLSIGRDFIRATAGGLGSGAGANITLSVGMSPGGGGGGLLFVSTDLNASGVGQGSGGTITLLSDNGASGGGVSVLGDLNVDAGSKGATGGSISIDGSNNAAGAPGVSVFGNLSADSSTGFGGTIALSTGSAWSNSVLVNGGKLSANGGAGGGGIGISSTDGITLRGGPITANGTGANANGGTISIADASVGGGGGGGIQGGSVTVQCDLLANAGANGTGGNVTISTSGDGNKVDLGPRTSVRAQGGALSGDGGSVSVSSPGPLSVKSTINVNAGNNGNGGFITLNSQGAGNAMTLGKQKIVTSLSADGGYRSGNGGTINLSSGDAIKVIEDTGKNLFDASARGVGNGGTLTISAASSASIGSDLKADGGNTSGNAGTISITASSLTMGKASKTIGLGHMSADAPGDGVAGTITTNTTGDQTLGYANITANAAGKGQAGSIILNSESGNIVTTANLSASETGKSGNGGNIELIASQGSTTIDGAVHCDSTNGNGGVVYVDGPSGDTDKKPESATGGLLGGQLIIWNSLSTPVPFIHESNVNESGKTGGGVVVLGAAGDIKIDHNVIAGANKNLPAGEIIIVSNESGASNSAAFKIGVQSENGIGGKVENLGNSFLSLSPSGIHNAGVTIEDLGKGGLQINDASKIQAVIQNGSTPQVPGNGMYVQLETNGTLTIGGTLQSNTGNCCASELALVAANTIKFLDGATVMASSTGSRGSAGTIMLSAATISVGNDVSIIAKGPHPSAPPASPLDSGQIAFLGQGAVTIDPVVVVSKTAGLQKGDVYVNLHPIGNLTVTGSKLHIDAVGGKKRVDGGWVNLSASSLKLNAPITINTNQTATISAASISQGSKNDVLTVFTGTLSINTTGSQALGSAKKPITVNAPTLQFSTQSNTFLSIINVSCTLNNSSVQGNLTLTTDKNLYTADSATLSVRGLATIMAGGQLGASRNSPFDIASSSVIGAPLTAVLESGVNKNLPTTVRKNLFVEADSDITLNSGSAGGVFYLKSYDNITLAAGGSIKSQLNTTLLTLGTGQIILQRGSSIQSVGNVFLLAGGATGSRGLTQNPEPLATSGGTVTYGKSPGATNSYYVSAPVDWLSVALAGNNKLNTAFVDGVGFQVLINPGRIVNPGISLFGTTISAGQAKVALLRRNSTGEDSGALAPVAFSQLLPRMPGSTINVARLENCTFYSRGAARLWRSTKGCKLDDGRVLIDYQGEQLPLLIGGLEVILRGKIVAEIARDNSGLSITNLTDSRRDSLIVKTSDGRELALELGKRLSIGRDNDMTPQRNVTSTDIRIGSMPRISEVSLPYILGRGELVSRLKGTGLFRRILRNAACLAVVRASKGTPYR